MVSPNARSIAKEVDDLIEERDVVGILTVATGTALGGVVAEVGQDWIMETMGRAPDSTTGQGLALSAGVKLLIAALFGFLAIRMDGAGKLVTGILGLGAMTEAGVDLLESIDTFRTGGTTAAPRNTSRNRGRGGHGRPAQRNRRPRRARPSGNSRQRSATASNSSSSGSSSSNSESLMKSTI